MFLASFLLHTLVVFFGFGPYAHVHAHSTTPRPIARVEHPTTHALEILPRTSNALHARTVPDKAPILRHSDAFRLVLSAFDETFHLHLRPNTDLLHPDARIDLYRPGPDGVAYRYASKPLIPQDVLAYEGEVVLASHSESRMREDTARLVRPNMGAGSVGWARIMIHHQGNAAVGVPPVYEGAFTYNGIIHHVSTRTKYLRTRRDLDPRLSADAGLDGELVIWRDSDVMSHEEELSAKLTGPTIVAAREPRTCAHDALSFNSDPTLNPLLRPKPRASTPLDSPWYDPFGLGMPQSMANSTVKRDDVVSTGSSQTDNFVHTIGDTAGCPQEQKIVFTGVAADCEYVKQYGSVENATTTILNDWNTVSSLYKQTFNISLGIIKLEIHDPTCPTTADPATPWNVQCSTMNLDTRLSVFSAWRANKGDDGAGLWHLLSGCPTGDEVGIAWLGTLCQQTGSASGNATVSGTAVSTAGLTEWQVIAHETGHNFGAIHDCASGCKNGDMCCQINQDTCDAKSAFLMSPTATTYEMKFSPCSIGNICSLMKGPIGGGLGFTNQTCLSSPLAPNSPKLISLEQCGNGIVEAGEECDPGQNGDNGCCTSDCELKPGAQCDPGNGSCCTANCAFAPSSLVCRPSKDDQCDTAETCTGSSATCPNDVFKPNGQSCGSGLACASGVCTSNNKQCQQLGSSLGLQEECPQASSTCTVTCQDPKNSRQCITLQSKLLDGSPCGYGGTCVNNKCQSGPFLDMVKSWFTKNLSISIPIAIGAGIVVLLILWALISSCCSCGRSSPPPPAVAPVMYATPNRPPSGPAPNVLRQASPHRSTEPPLTRPSTQPQQGQYGHASRPSANSSVDVRGPRALPYPPAGGTGTAAYQREVRNDGDWVSFGGGAGQGANTYSGWGAPR